MSGRLLVVSGLGTIVALALSASTYCDVPSTGPATAPVVPGFPPITYFQDNCAKCHGSYGSTYTPGMASRYTDAALRDKLDQMAAGPSQAPVGEAELDLLLAYQKSLNDGKPFVSFSSVISPPNGATEVTGEVTPGAKVVVSAGVARADAVVDGHSWKAQLPGSGDAKSVRVKASVGASSVEASLTK